MHRTFSKSKERKIQITEPANLLFEALLIPLD